MHGDDDCLTSVPHAEQRRGASPLTTPSGRRTSQLIAPPGRQRPRLPALSAGVGLVVVAVSALLAALLSTTTTPPPAALPASADASKATPGGGASTSATVAPLMVAAGDLAALPRATTFGATPAAPRDPSPDAVPTGLVAHPVIDVPGFAYPGGAPVALVPSSQPIGLPGRQASIDTWLPVLDRRPGWVLVGLPSRPNNSVAWLHIAAVTLASTDVHIVVDRTAMTMSLVRDGVEIAHWRVGVGKPGAPTPRGRTFVLAVLRDPQPTFSPMIIALGAHSDTHTTYGGGPGTVGLHTWPSSSVFGTASSDGCVRIPHEALRTLTELPVPLGSAVLIK